MTMPNCIFPGYERTPGIPEEDYLDWLNLRLSWNDVKLNLDNMPPGLKIQTRTGTLFVVRQVHRQNGLVNQLMPSTVTQINH